MAIEVITREDLNEFRSLLLNDLKEIILSKPQQNNSGSNPMKSANC